LIFYEGVGLGVLKIEESESGVLCTDSTVLLLGLYLKGLVTVARNNNKKKTNIRKN
jgi:hypothetical protein